MRNTNFKFHGVVEKGRIKHDYPEKFMVYLAGLEGKRVELTLQKERNNRSNQQNKFYWAVVVEILAEYFGYTPEELHEALKYKFLLQHEDTLATVRSTTSLSTVEFMDYVDRITRWAATDYQIYIPDPNEVEFD